jgi:FkbM family methyltransferase
MISNLKARLRSTSIVRYYFVMRNSRRARLWSANDRRFLELYRPLVGPNALVFDIGANVGARLKVFLALGARVVAIEPQQKCYDTLQNAFKDRATILRLAVSDRAGVGTLMIPEGYHPVATMSPRWIENVTKARLTTVRWSSSEEIETTTLDQLIAQYGIPTFVKIDVEGHEINVLRGLSLPPRSLSVEFTPQELAQAILCLDRLEQIGSYEYNYSFGESAQLHLDRWLSAGELADFLRKTASDPESYGDIYARLVAKGH